MPDAILHIHQLRIGYRRSRQPDLVVADELDLSLKRGQLACLLGPNGAGKSTLLRTIAGMQPPLAGQVLLDGQTATAFSPRERARRLSVVLTDRPNLGLLNGYALVALGRHPFTDWSGRLDPHDEAVVRWALDAVGATAIADRRVMELSDGQRQKLMIARALAQEPGLMLLDEPTVFLDLPRRVEIMQLLRHLAHQTQRAVLVSTHDLDLALRTADTLWLMSRGRVITGAPEDLVLSGAFEEAFRDEGVTFNPQTGAFYIPHHDGLQVWVAGHGLAETWTRRALERAGYQLAVHEDDAPIRIHITHSEPVWHLQAGQSATQHHSIDDLLHGLRQLDPLSAQ